MKPYRLLPLLLLPVALALSPGAQAQTHAAKPAAPVTLSDAVNHVQHETNGQVLSAESRRWDRRTEYRIKVLTPQGHVRVMTVPAGSGENNHSLSPSTRLPPARRGGGKEKN